MSDNIKNWSDIEKVIKMVISTETICAPEQGYMVFHYLNIQQCLFCKFSFSKCGKEKVHIKTRPSASEN